VSTCRELYDKGTTESGVYVVKPGVRAYCSMGLMDSGWTVITRRVNYSNQFMKKNYKDFIDGFGDFSGNYFLGLETLHEMTSTSTHEAYIGMEYTDEHIPFAFARYSSFAVGDRKSGYMLSLGSYIATVPGNDPLWAAGGNGMGPHHGASFSAKDSLNPECGKEYGGWWYNRCDQPSYQACNYNKWHIFLNKEIKNFVFAIREI